MVFADAFDELHALIVTSLYVVQSAFQVALLLSPLLMLAPGLCLEVPHLSVVRVFNSGKALLEAADFFRGVGQFIG